MGETHRQITRPIIRDPTEAKKQALNKETLEIKTKHWALKRRPSMDLASLL